MLIRAQCAAASCGCEVRIGQVVTRVGRCGEMELQWRPHSADSKAHGRGRAAAALLRLLCVDLVHVPLASHCSPACASRLTSIGHRPTASIHRRMTTASASPASGSSFLSLKHLLLADESWRSLPTSSLAALASARDSSRRSLLFYVTTSSAAEFLLAHGCDAELRDKYGQCALHTAVAGGQLNVVKVLLRHRPSLLELRDEAQRQPVHEAADREMLESAPQRPHRLQRLPLSSHLYPFSWHCAAVRCLHAAGADLQSADGHGETLLHKSARIGREDIVTSRRSRHTAPR